MKEIVLAFSGASLAILLFAALKPVSFKRALARVLRFPSAGLQLLAFIAIAAGLWVLYRVLREKVDWLDLTAILIGAGLVAKGFLWLNPPGMIPPMRRLALDRTDAFVRFVGAVGVVGAALLGYAALRS